MQTAYDALILGAGPAGSTAAILLARAGWSVALLEKQPFPRRKVCGECIAASNLPLLEALGIGAAFAALAGPALRRVALWYGAQSVSAPLPAAADATHPWGRALGREHLDTLLLQQARSLGVTVLQPCSAQSVSGQPGQLRCEAIGTDPPVAVTLTAPVVIAAHGSWQPLPAQRALGRRERRGADLLAFKANFRNVRLEAGVLPVLSFRGGYGGMVVADHGVATLACCIRADRLAECRQAAPGAQAGAAVEAALKRECAGVLEALSGASAAGAWLAAGPIQPGVRLSRAGTGAFLIGNAAGEAHPIIGEGISMAIQSAWLLCGQLLRCRDVLRQDEAAPYRQREIQRRYAAQWHEQFRERLRLATWFAHAAMRPEVMSCLMPLVRRAPRMLSHCALWGGKTRGLAQTTLPHSMAQTTLGPDA